MKKRLLSIVLALALALSLIPAGSAASGTAMGTLGQGVGKDWGTVSSVRVFEVAIPVGGTVNVSIPSLTGYSGSIATRQSSAELSLIQISFVSTAVRSITGLKEGTATVTFAQSVGVARDLVTVYINIVPAGQSTAVTTHVHRYKTVVQSASCEEDGYTYHECAVCRDRTEQKAIYATGHIYDGGRVTRQPTAAQPGVRTYTCVRCQDSYTESIPATGSTAANPGAGTNPGTEEPGTGAEPGNTGTTPENPGTDPGEGHTHSWETRVVTPATCTSTGLSQEVCTVCGQTQNRKTLPRIDHTWVDQEEPATCTKTGLRWQECSVCGTKQGMQSIAKTAHDYVAAVTREPTTTQQGMQTYTCSVCGASYTEAIPVVALDPSAPHVSGSTAMSKLSKEEIVQLLKDNPNTLPVSDIYDVVPSCTAPYSPGKVKDVVLRATLNRLNALRRLAGVPAVELDQALCESAQYGAVLLAVSDFSHTPAKPADMDDAFYQTAKAATSSSNIYSGGPLPSRPDGYMDDSDGGNVDRLGHRRWQLNPTMGKIGFGTASRTGGSSGPSTEKVFDRSGAGCDYDFIGWPASGNFPSNLFGGNVAWSVTLNPAQYQTPSQSQIKVTLTRKSDGKVWSFSGSSYTAASSGAYFHVDTAGYGVSNCIIFRPDGVKTYEGVYSVRIDGLKTKAGQDVTNFEYEVEFFDVNAPSTSTETPKATFTDVSSDFWAYKDIQQAYEDGVLEGTSYDAATGVRRFDPESTLEVAQFIAILTRGFYAAEVNASTAGSSPWYARNLEVCNRHGLLDGLGQVNMGSGITRYQMARMMLNVLHDKGKPNPSQAELNSAISKIGDWSQVGSAYQEAVSVCYQLGLLRGKDSAGTFKGTDTLKRSECAAVYIRLKNCLS